MRRGISAGMVLLVICVNSSFTPIKPFGGVTNLVVFENNSGYDIILSNRQNRKDEWRRVDAKSTLTPDGGGLPVPWVTTTKEFNDKVMEVQFYSHGAVDAHKPVGMYYIWQHEVNGQDRVRLSEKGWQDQGTPVGGYSDTGDKRKIIFGDKVGGGITVILEKRQ